MSGGMTLGTVEGGHPTDTGKCRNAESHTVAHFG